MSDLLGGSGSARAANGGAARAPGPVPVGQSAGTPQQQKAQRAQMTTPRDIMRKREERAAEAARARREAERPARETVDDSEVARQSGQDIPERQRSGHRRATSGAQRRSSGDNNPVAEPIRRPAPTSAPVPAQLEDDYDDQPELPASYRPRVPSQSQDHPQVIPGSSSQPIPSSSQRQPAPAVQPSTSRQRQPVSAQPSGSANTGGASIEARKPTTSGTVSSFPHAFERWETLSSHWEGLTSYWIRKLDQNTEELQRQPLMAQLSRQVTDLSAAGANLFHAVVELQRLRASSERKFQRWFFESRKEQERAQEIAAQLEETLAMERAARAKDIARVQADLDNAQRAERNAVTLVQEIRRELQISKDEARRAWEELGRREAEDRDRILALNNKQPIDIGGIQVYPTMQAAPSEMDMDPGEGSPTNTDPFIGEGPPQPEMAANYGAPYSLESSFARSDSTARTAIPYASAAEHHAAITSAGAYRPMPAGAHPQSVLQPVNVLSVSHSASQAAASIPAPGYYQHPDPTYLGEHDPFTDLEDEFMTDAQGRILFDSQGRPVRVQGRRRANTTGTLHSEDDYDTAADIAHEEALHRQYAGILPISAPGSSSVMYPSVPAPTSSGVTQPGTYQLTTSSLPPLSARIPATTSSPSSNPLSTTTSNGHQLSPPHPTAIPPPVPAAPMAPTPDYTGSGYGSGAGLTGTIGAPSSTLQSTWDAGRNYYPSRLSDVLELDEEERSRMSEASGYSGGNSASARGMTGGGVAGSAGLASSRRGGGGGNASDVSGMPF